jgi:predicted transcriptional regulator of viral defense system
MRRDPQENAQGLYRIAASQGGYFSAAQAREAGYSYRQQSYHRGRGNWLLIDRGIYRLRDFPSGEREDLIRWSLWSRNRKGTPQAVVSHESALTVHDLSDVMPERVHLTVPKTFRKRVPVGCVLHVASLAEEEVEPRPGYSVTTPLRTLVDVAGSALSQEHLNIAVRDALERGLVRRAQLRSARCQPGARERVDRALESIGQLESQR